MPQRNKNRSKFKKEAKFAKVMHTARKKKNIARFGMTHAKYRITKEGEGLGSNRSKVLENDIIFSVELGIDRRAEFGIPVE